MTQASQPVSQRTLHITLVGNPNTGKTTLFNALTGLRHRVGNYAGVTVETKIGRLELAGGPARVTDVPGTYSLSPRSPDEWLTVELLLGLRREEPPPDVIVAIVDATNLERNLYLVTQVMELDRPVVLAINMMDLAEEQGIRLDLPELSRRLGIPVVGITAHRKRNLDQLRSTLREAAEGPPPKSPRVFPEIFARRVDALAVDFPEIPRYLLERILLDARIPDSPVVARLANAALLDRLRREREPMEAEGIKLATLEAKQRYAWIRQQVAGCVERPPERLVTWSDRIDRILLHRWLGPLVFLLIMGFLFQAIYSFAGYPMQWIEAGFQVVGEALEAILPDGALRELLLHGVVGGVGGVLVFLPQIVLLFGFIAILEDCGYMARAAFLMDRIMSRCGLSGKSFIPMLSSFACAVPGIMATRTIEDRRDRLATILVAPLMSCSARLPVYTLLIAAFIPNRFLFEVPLGSYRVEFGHLGGFVLFVMYGVGLVVAPLVAWALKRTLLRGERPVFLMELPSYKWPQVWAVVDRMVDRGLAFILRAGSIILATAIIVWALQYYPRSASVAAEFAPELERLDRAIAEAESRPAEGRAVVLETLEEEREATLQRRAARFQEESFLGRMGRAVEPAVRPLGWDWKIAMAVIASFPAREVVIGALGTIYSVGQDVDETSESLIDRMRAEQWPDGGPIYTLPVALGLMVFFALCCQCAATLAVIGRETRSWSWPVFTFVYMTLLAYVGAWLTYSIGTYLSL